MLLFSHLSTSSHLSSGVFNMLSSLLEYQFTEIQLVKFAVTYDEILKDTSVH